MGTFYALLFIKTPFFTQSIDQLIENTVPASIRMQRSMKMDDPVCKFIILYIYYMMELDAFVPNQI